MEPPHGKSFTLLHAKNCRVADLRTPRRSLTTNVADLRIPRNLQQTTAVIVDFELVVQDPAQSEATPTGGSLLHQELLSAATDDPAGAQGSVEKKEWSSFLKKTLEQAPVAEFSQSLMEEVNMEIENIGDLGSSTLRSKMTVADVLEKPLVVSMHNVIGINWGRFGEREPRPVLCAVGDKIKFSWNTTSSSENSTTYAVTKSKFFPRKGRMIHAKFSSVYVSSPS